MYSKWHPILTKRNNSKRAKVQPNKNFICSKGYLSPYASHQFFRTLQNHDQHYFEEDSNSFQLLNDSNNEQFQNNNETLDESLELYELNFDDSSSEEEDDDGYGQQEENYEMIDYAAALLALFYSTNSTQETLKSFCDLIKVFCPNIPTDFNKCAQILSQELGQSHSYERKIYCNKCQVYSEYVKSCSYCKTCNTK
jgi:hypothetical protein